MNKDYFTLWTAIAPSSYKMDFSIFIREVFLFLCTLHGNSFGDLGINQNVNVESEQ